VREAAGLGEASGDGGRLWLGLGAAASSLKETNHSSCGGGYQVIDTVGSGASLRAEGEWPLPASPAVIWAGGRAGYHHETVKLSGDITGQDTVSTWYGQAWVEREGPSLTVGLAVLGARLHGNQNWSQPTASNSYDVGQVLPGGHLRFGAPGFGFDAGFLDRQSNVDPPGFHVGLSGAFGPDGKRLESMREMTLRFHLELTGLPGMYGFTPYKAQLADVLTPAFGFGIEFKAAPRIFIGFDAAVGQGVAGAAFVRTPIGGK
jgi:hypothetical protein